MPTLLLLSWLLAGPVAAPPAMPASLDAASLAALSAAVQARMGATAEVLVDAVSRVTAPTAAVNDAVLDPQAALGLPSRVVWRAPGRDQVLVPVGGATLVLRVAVDHVHTTRKMRRGQTLEDGDVVVARHALARGALRRLPEHAEVIGALTVRDLEEGACLVTAAIAPQPAVRPGAEVTGVVRIDGIEVRAQLVALDAGRLGGRIRVMNPDSRRTFRARIVSRDLVEIQP